MFMLRPIIIIVGPTASGKSALGVALAKQFDGEVISADSRQVYRGLDIATGKVTKREMANVPHHLLDIATPKRRVSAHEFSLRARKAINEIEKRNHTPIVVGGTGFYIDALTGRVTPAAVPPDPKFRAQLQKKTAVQLFVMLKKKDTRRAAAMDTPSERNNKVRLIRALEIAAVAGSYLFSEASPTKGSGSNSVADQYTARCEEGMRKKTNNSQLPRNALWIGIAPTFEELDANIQKRLTARIRRGMIAEAKRLHAAGLSYKRMRELGLEYRSLARLLQGHIDRKEFETELSHAIRRYARSQMRYWKRNKEIHWFHPHESKNIHALVEQFISQCGVLGSEIRQ